MEEYRQRPIKVAITDFMNLRDAHGLYIDKTEYMWSLIQDRGDVYFMARPRRFGKTMFLSALNYLFLGKKNSSKDSPSRKKTTTGRHIRSYT